MRIFLSAQQALRPHAVPGYAFWQYYFKQGLTEAGHTVIEAPGIDWAGGLVKMERAEHAAWLNQTWESVINFLQQEHTRNPVDMFLSYLFPQQVDASAIRTIRDLGIPCVNFFCDNVREFTRVPSSFSEFDLHWVPEADARSMYAAAGLSWIYAPMPMWVRPEYRRPPATESVGATFIGSHDMLREELLGSAVKLGLKLNLYGPGWMPEAQIITPPPRRIGALLKNQWSFLRTQGLRGVIMRATYQMRPAPARDWIGQCWRPPLEKDEYFHVTRKSQVIIGINRYPGFRHAFSNPGRYSRLRDIEAPMLGACYLTEDAPGLDDLYEIGREIETYRSAEELTEKVKALQQDTKRREALRLAGQRRALVDHTIDRTIDRISKHLK